MIKLESLCKDYKIYKKKSGFIGSIQNLFSNKYTLNKAVIDMSFTVEKGEIVGYVGSNGAGKSTTIKMMSGILTPTSGKCTVGGIIPYENVQKNAKNIGVVFGQRTQLWWDLPLSDTFMILKEMYSITDIEFNKNYTFLSEILEVDTFIDNPVRTLSLGQRMRADLMAALIHNPKVLYLDEPTIGLDVIVKDKLRKAIKHINKEYNTTILLTTHDMTDIEELCNRIIIIDKGQKIYDGTLNELKAQYGFMKTINIVFKNCQSEFKGNQYNFNLDVLEIKQNDNGISVIFNKNKISASNIILSVLSKHEASDIEIQDTSLTEIIKMIYENQ